MQAEFGANAVFNKLGQLFGELSVAFVDSGIEWLIVAGGETSGAVVEALALNVLSLRPEIDPCVPALRAGKTLTMAFKSGNFGTDNFFQKAALVLAVEIL